MPIWIVDFFKDVLVTSIGAFVGVIGGWKFSHKIAQWQIDKQNEDKRKDEHRLLRTKIDRVATELRNNKNVVKQLEKAISKCPDARLDMWEWAEAITNGFSFRFYDSLIASGLNKHLPKHIDDSLFRAYDLLHGLYHMVKQSTKAHSFHYAYSADVEAADASHENLKRIIATYLSDFNDHVDTIYSFKKEMENDEMGTAK